MFATSWTFFRVVWVVFGIQYVKIKQNHRTETFHQSVAQNLTYCRDHTVNTVINIERNGHLTIYIHTIWNMKKKLAICLYWFYVQFGNFVCLYGFRFSNLFQLDFDYQLRTKSSCVHGWIKIIVRCLKQFDKLRVILHGNRISEQTQY